jgi:hypothetical protein
VSQPVRENLERLKADAKQYVARWTLTWVPTPERQIGLRPFLEANLIAVLSEAYGSIEQWKGIGGRSQLAAAAGILKRTRKQLLDRGYGTSRNILSMDVRRRAGWSS